jgi:hypothetical protein
MIALLRRGDDECTIAGQTGEFFRQFADGVYAEDDAPGSRIVNI